MVAGILIVGSVWAFWPRQPPTGAPPQTQPTTPQPTTAAEQPLVWVPSDPSTDTETVSEGNSTEASDTPAAVTTAPTVALFEAEPIPSDGAAVTRLTAVPADTSPVLLASLAAAVAARLTAETTGVGRDRYPDTLWRTRPCCEWVELRALAADFSDDTVHVVVEWETELGSASGPSWWVTDQEGNWIPATG